VLNYAGYKGNLPATAGTTTGGLAGTAPVAR
jgi:hypothetical protein